MLSGQLNDPQLYKSVIIVRSASELTYRLRSCFRGKLSRCPTFLRSSGPPGRGSTVRQSNDPGVEALFIALVLRLHVFLGPSAYHFLDQPQNLEEPAD